MITGFHHVCMKCDKPELFDRAKELYCGIFGMSIKRQWTEGVMIDLGNGVIEIFNNGEGRMEQGAIQHFALASDDVDSDVEKVRQAGYKVTMEPKSVTMQSVPPFPIRVAFFVGPLGEEIELFQEL